MAEHPEDRPPKSDDSVSLDSGSHPSSPAERLEKLLAHRPRENKYEVRDEVARGGMGRILEVWDDDLRRTLAMKVIRDDVRPGFDPKGEHLDLLVRFLDEAQITGQLHHPGVVPVYELGVDQRDRTFFTMRLVKGQSFAEILEMARAGEDGWSITRAVGVLHKVCETVAYAHARSVIHRDLKPANVMVGQHGQVYVMDWGLAKVLGSADRHDLRWSDEVAATLSRVVTDREVAVGETPDSPLLTRDGTVIGTPAYMAPEQALGRVDEVGPASDIYSVGAMLYHLLTGEAPYVPAGARMAPEWVVKMVAQGPPRRVEEIDRSAVPELVAVCEVAMAREAADRYPAMDEMASDLRAYLEGRVVRAHRTGALVEFRKWAMRNRAVAAVAAALLVVLVASGFVIANQESTRAVLVERERDERLAESLVREVADLWPVHPDSAPAFQAWLGQARGLVAGLPDLEAELAALRRRAVEPAGEPGATWAATEEFERTNLRHRRDGLRGTLELRRQQLADPDLPPDSRRRYEPDPPLLEREVAKLTAMLAEADRRAARRTWRFDDPETAREHDRLARMVENLRRLAGGLLAEVEARLARAERLEARSVTEHAEAWRAALQSIRDPEQCPHYAGMRTFEPQLGLVPLRRDPASKLWEFWHVLSGDRPESAGGAWEVAPETGLVLVLVPGGTFWMGAERGGARNRDPLALRSEGPVHEVSVEPYFLSKYELTQEQWFRVDGTWPAANFIGMSLKYNAQTISPVHPVDHVSWEECDVALRRWNLRLPTEAEWERAARALTGTPYYTGDDFGSLADAVNSSRGQDRLLAADDTDGYQTTARVDVFAPNPFGLHNVLGNVWEWCADWYSPRYGATPGDPHGEHVPQLSITKTCRGGSYSSDPEDLRVSARHYAKKDAKHPNIGLRPSRSIRWHGP